MHRTGPLPALVDLTLPGTATWGTAARKSLAGAHPAEVLWCGDANFDGALRYTGGGNDRDPILQQVGGAIPTHPVNGYLGTDVNMDGTVRYTGQGNDRDPILLNIGGAVPTNQRASQLPE